MRIGIVILPDARWSAAEPKWRRAEEYGFDHVWTYDHIGWLDFVDGPWFGAVPTLTAAGLVTSRIKLGLFVASPNFRHPVPFMRELIALDDMSEGRFVLGLGAGDAGYDAEVLGGPALSPSQRMDRFSEFVDVLHGLLTSDGFHHQGRYYTAKDARNLPGPLQQPRFDFLIAANGPRGMRLAADHGAAWATTGPAVDSQSRWWTGLAEIRQRFDDALARAERDPQSLARYVNLDAAPVDPLSSAEAFTEAAARAAELGFTDMVVRWPRSTLADRTREAVLERVAADLLPQLQNGAASR